ncbi:MAG: EamA family transporter [Candidatus Thorarchaeota archaeon]|nr:EamA family transporter [Candidatus Thorarchaeota archaeon]
MQTATGVYILGVLASIITAALFAATNVVYKKLGDRITPLEIVITRSLISLPLAIVLVLPPFNPDGISLTLDGFLFLTFSMVIGLVIGDLLYFESQERIGVSRAFPISASYPLLVYLLAALFLNEPVIPTRVLGAIMVVVGIGLITRDQHKQARNSTEDQEKIIIGVGLALVTFVAWALSDLTLQVGLIDVDPLDANFIRIIIGVIVFLPLVPYSGKKSAIRTDRKLLGIVLATGFVGFSVTLVLLTFAVAYIGATVNSVILAASPLVSTPISIVILDEKATGQVIVGTILAFLGVALVVLVF